MKTTILHLDGLTCHACAKLITKRITSILDVTDVTVELPGTATLSADREIPADEVRQVLKGTPYVVHEQ